MIRSFLIALGFLTIIPTPTINNWQKEDFKKSISAYPIVGLVIALILFFAALLLQSYQPFLRSGLIISLWFILTGALHFDGFCDIADAVFAAKPAAERQIIAKDPRIGSFALLAGVLLVVLKIATLASIDISYLLIIPIISRTFIVLVIPGFKLQSSSQLAKASIISWRQSLFIFAFGVSLSLIIAWMMTILLPVIAVMLFGLVLLFLLAAWINKRMQGLNGDAYGAIIETIELSCLLFLSLFFG